MPTNDVAADGDVASAPRVRTPTSLAHRSATHLCSQVNSELGEEQAMQVTCSTQPQAARRTTNPTRSYENGSLSPRLHSQTRGLQMGNDAFVGGLEAAPLPGCGVVRGIKSMGVRFRGQRP